VWCAIHVAHPGHLGVSGPNAWHLVFEPGLRIHFKGRYAHSASMAAARALLAPR